MLEQYPSSSCGVLSPLSSSSSSSLSTSSSTYECTTQAEKTCRSNEDKEQLARGHVNEQGEHEEKMSVNCLLNNTPPSSNDIIQLPTTSSTSANEIARLSDSYNSIKDIREIVERPFDDYIEYIEGSPPTTPYPSTDTPHAVIQSPQRAPCSVCKSENGRCHASDPATMQTFFATTLGFEGVLNVSDWLCMKCYSKWYNRCKRRATSALAITVVDPSLPPLPQQKRKRRDKDKDVSCITVDREKKEDIDCDDALLLARIGSFGPSNSDNNTPEDTTDLENATFEELRTEVIRLRKDMRKMIGDISQRDVQIEGMMSFVRDEISSMHNLLKDLHSSSKWNPTSVGGSSSAASASVSSPSPALSSPCNSLPSLASLPISFNVPSLHS